MSSVDYTRLANEFGISEDAVLHLARAIKAGNGTQAQFNHPDLGGMGQWMPSMTMIGDAFNQQLKAKVDALCSRLSDAYQQGNLGSTASQSTRWWDSSLGQVTMQGEQNTMRYAYFPGKQRLIIERDGQQVTYDTYPHHLTGVAQQQTNTDKQKLIFQTTHGTISEDDLTRITT